MEDRCWFCEQCPADDAPVHVQMASEPVLVKVGFESKTYQYEAKYVAIPRCKTCRRAHRGETNFRLKMATLLFLIIPLIVIGVSAANGSTERSLGLVLFTLIPNLTLLWLVYLPIARRLAAKHRVRTFGAERKGTVSVRQAPALQILIAEKWHIRKVRDY